MEMKLDDLIPSGLLKLLEAEDRTLYHTKDGWLTIPMSSIVTIDTLTQLKNKVEENNSKIDEVIAKLDRIGEEVKL